MSIRRWLYKLWKIRRYTFFCIECWFRSLVFILFDQIIVVSRRRLVLFGRWGPVYASPTLRRCFSVNNLGLNLDFLSLKFSLLIHLLNMINLTFHILELIKNLVHFFSLQYLSFGPTLSFNLLPVHNLVINYCFLSRLENTLLNKDVFFDIYIVFKQSEILSISIFLHRLHALLQNIRSQFLNYELVMKGLLIERFTFVPLFFNFDLLLVVAILKLF